MTDDRCKMPDDRGRVTDGLRLDELGLAGLGLDDLGLADLGRD